VLTLELKLTNTATGNGAKVELIHKTSRDATVPEICRDETDYGSFTGSVINGVFSACS